jgi:hypothetical protein
MKMPLALLEKVFTDTETEDFLLEDVKQIALLFVKCAKSIGADLQDDYWIQLGKYWDLNIYQCQYSVYGQYAQKVVLYKIIDGNADTQNPIVIEPFLNTSKYVWNG